MSQKPTLILVPGAWHSAETWSKVTLILEAQHYKCVPVTLPSTLSNPSVTLFDDIKAVRDAIEAETKHGRDVVLVVHSYGGGVGPSAIKGLARPKDGSESTTQGHVIGIASMASGFGPSGVSFVDGMGGKPPPSWKVDTESGYVVLVAEPRDLFYHDLPEEEGNYWVGKLTRQASKPLMEGGEWAYAGWMDVPVWYLATTEDHAFPYQAQTIMTQMAKDRGGDITMREVASSHSPMLSKPKEVAAFITEAVEAFAG